MTKFVTPLSKAPIPSVDWKLEKWMEHCGPDITIASIDRRAVEFAARLNLPVKQRDAKRLYVWKENGILEREWALAVLLALGDHAANNNISLLNGPQFAEHARIFLRSGACAHKFADLDEDELEKFALLKRHFRASHFQGAPPVVENNYQDLVRRVYPRPPGRESLFGRDDDLEQVIMTMRNAPITSIISVAGNGKTSLAWYAALEAVNRGLVRFFDWTTDKRVMVDIDGNPTATGEQRPLDFTRILRSMASRFGWEDARVEEDPVRLRSLCSKHLQLSPYLLVVDNIETVPQHEDVVEELWRILMPDKKLAQQLSRALITSRREVNNRENRIINIKGLELRYATQLIRHQEDVWRNRGAQKLTDAQINQLWHTSLGNPLFLIIALSRYTRRDSSFQAIIGQLDEARDSFERAFNTLFRPLYEELSEAARWLSLTAAQFMVVGHESLLLIFLDNGGNRDEFSKAMIELIDWRVIERSSDTEYSFHPLIRRFLLNETDTET